MSRCGIIGSRGWRGGALRGLRLSVTSWCGFGDGDGLVAAGAGPADARGAHEGVAVLAALLPEGAGVAAVADVDGHGPFAASGRDGRLGRWGLVAGPPGGDPAG